MLLTYLYLRSGPEGLSWLTDKAIAADLGIGPKKLSPHFRQLEERGFIATKRLGRNRYVKLIDPMMLAERALVSTSLPTTVHQRLKHDLDQIKRAQKTRARTLGEET